MSLLSRALGVGLILSAGPVFAAEPPGNFDLQAFAGDIYLDAASNSKFTVAGGRSGSNAIMRLWSLKSGGGIGLIQVAGQNYYDVAINSRVACGVGIINDDNADGGSNLRITCITLKTLLQDNREFEAPGDNTKNIHSAAPITPKIYLSDGYVVVTVNAEGAPTTRTIVLQEETLANGF